MTYRKKLIEVSLPLEAINKEAGREKSIRHGHPSTLHLWWARRPLATCRAVLFASLIDDPGEHPELFPTEKEQGAERKRLFDLIEKMVKWENSNDAKFMEQVREEIRKATGDNPPPVLDPFAGGGSIPLEAQRLGLEAHASDLNPVAVLINKALIEIPPKFANMPPINPDAQKTLLQREWHGAQGLADDVRYYGKWMRDEAEKRIGHLYPGVTLPKEYGEGDATVIAWIWARTVRCPNPACAAQMPLARSFQLSTKNNTYIDPSIDYTTLPPTIHFSVRTDKNNPKDGTVNRLGAKCIACGEHVPFEYIRNEAKAGRMGEQMLAIVAEGKKRRLYLSPSKDQNAIALQAHPVSVPETDLPQQALGFRIQAYGMLKHCDLFSLRQLTALTTFSDLIQDVREKILSNDFSRQCNIKAGILEENAQDVDYANAITTYLALTIDRCVDYWSAICSWHSSGEKMRNTFARQAIPMVWDFTEANPFSNSSGCFDGALEWVAEVVALSSCSAPGEAVQRDATTSVNGLVRPLISTDPPYYDNIGYADLSDFFYVWLRRSLSAIYPDLFNTMLVPKVQELIATPYRFGGSKQKAQQFFEHGLHQTFEHMRAVQHPDYPLTVYYAFKQAEAELEQADATSEGDPGSQAVASTGWETMLTGLIDAGFTITGTWPMRTEMMNRSVGQNTNALASSIVLVCRPRSIKALSASRRQFINELRDELEDALKEMQHDGIAPVDLAQASIGPGMKIFSQYSQILESDGSPLSVRTALQLINRELDNILATQEGEYDVETRWAVAWFGEHAMEVGLYGQAETFSKAKNVSLHALVEAGLLEAKSGKVRLRKRDELASNWQPEMHTHRQLTIWEVMQRMIHALDKQGTVGAGTILAALPEYGDTVRDLAYHLYNICERKGWSAEGQYYNMLVLSWPDVEAQARTIARSPKQASLSFD